MYLEWLCREVRSYTKADVLRQNWKEFTISPNGCSPNKTLGSFHVQIMSTRSKVNLHGTSMPAAGPLPRVYSPAHTAQILPWAAAFRRRHHSEAAVHASDFSHSQMDEGLPKASHMRQPCRTSEPEGVRRDGIKSLGPASPRWWDQQAVERRKRARWKVRDTSCGVDVDRSEGQCLCC